jgi:hypothetical protein
LGDLSIDQQRPERKEDEKADAKVTEDKQLGAIVSRK